MTNHRIRSSMKHFSVGTFLWPKCGRNHGTFSRIVLDGQKLRWILISWMLVARILSVSAFPTVCLWLINAPKDAFSLQKDWILNLKFGNNHLHKFSKVACTQTWKERVWGCFFAFWHVLPLDMSKTGWCFVPFFFEQSTSNIATSQQPLRPRFIHIPCTFGHTVEESGMLGGIVGSKVGFDRSFPKMMMDFLGNDWGFSCRKSTMCQGHFSKGPRLLRHEKYCTSISVKNPTKGERISIWCMYLIGLKVQFLKYPKFNDTNQYKSTFPKLFGGMIYDNIREFRWKFELAVGASTLILWFIQC